MRWQLRQDFLGLRAQLTAFLFGALTISGLWAGIGLICPWLWPLVAAMGLLIWTLPVNEDARGLGMAQFPVSARDQQNEGVRLEEALIVGAAFMLPAGLYLIATWNQEFPLVGDHDFHLAQSLMSYGFWKSRFVPVLGALIGLLFWAVRMPRWFRPRPLWVPGLLGVLLLITAFIPPGPMTFAVRYPGSYHFLLFPLRALWQIAAWPSPLNAQRLLNFLAIPGWLFLLRPWILRRWPDRSLLPVAFFAFWQKDLIYYFTTCYLEPWALIVMAVAAELLLREGARRRYTVWLLLGMAAIFKEQIIFVLPFAVLPTVTRAELTGPNGRTPSFVMALAVFPFFIYYCLRRTSQVWRTAGFASLSEIFSSSRALEFVHRVWEQWGPALFLVAAIFGVTLWLGHRQNRARAPGPWEVASALVAAASFQVCFFYADRISVAWTGYARFHLVPQIFLGLLLIPIGTWVHERWHRRGVVLLCTICLLGNAPGLTSLAQTSSGSGMARNFFEHYDAPVFLPFDRVISRARAQGILNGVVTIRVEAPGLRSLLGGYLPMIYSQAYPQIANAYRLTILNPGNESTACHCTRTGEATVALSVNFTGLMEHSPQRAATEQVDENCRAAMRASCARFTEYVEEGHTLGVLGVF